MTPGRGVPEGAGSAPGDEVEAVKGWRAAAGRESSGGGDGRDGSLADREGPSRSREEKEKASEGDVDGTKGAGVPAAEREESGDVPPGPRSGSISAPPCEPSAAASALARLSAHLLVPARRVKAARLLRALLSEQSDALSLADAPQVLSALGRAAGPTTAPLPAPAALECARAFAAAGKLAERGFFDASQASALRTLSLFGHERSCIVATDDSFAFSSALGSVRKALEALEGDWDESEGDGAGVWCGLAEGKASSGAQGEGDAETSRGRGAGDGNAPAVDVPPAAETPPSASAPKDVPFSAAASKEASLSAPAPAGTRASPLPPAGSPPSSSPSSSVAAPLVAPSPTPSLPLDPTPARFVPFLLSSSPATRETARRHAVREAAVAALEAARRASQAPPGSARPWTRSAADAALEQVAGNLISKLAPAQRRRVRALADAARVARAARQAGSRADDRTAFERASDAWAGSERVSKRRAVGGKGDHSSEVWLG